MRTYRGEVEKATRIAASAIGLGVVLFVGTLFSCGKQGKPIEAVVPATTAERATFKVERFEIEVPGMAGTDGPGRTGGSSGSTERVVLEYPVYIGGADASVQEIVNQRIGPRAYFDTDFAGLKAAFGLGERPFDEATAGLTFQGKDIAQVVWTVTLTGAYTSTSRKTVTVDLLSGNLLGSEYLFNDDLAVSRFVQERMAPKIIAATEEAATAAGVAQADTAEVIRELAALREYTPDMIFEAEWSLEGMTFVMPFDFPHALRALEPDPIRETVSWLELVRFSYPGSLMERFLSTEGR